eukprot:1652280-Prymnesium_polylepis.1
MGVESATEANECAHGRVPCTDAMTPRPSLPSRAHRRATRQPYLPNDTFDQNIHPEDLPRPNK